uniref:Uncharacterized protein n=1 Tax=Anguilla anguilla TaxID=7936 RepID=A0A0E9WQF3_ANGAN
MLSDIQNSSSSEACGRLNSKQTGQQSESLAEVPGAKSLVLSNWTWPASPWKRSSGHHPSARLGAQNPTPLPQTEALSLSKGYTKTLCIPPNLTSTEFMRERPGRR